jgi:hypothetical protein
MKQLDLHGILHRNVEKIVIDFVHRHDTPFKIITGNSQAMKDIVLSALCHFSLDAHEESSYNKGALIVFEKRE